MEVTKPAVYVMAYVLVTITLVFGKNKERAIAGWVWVISYSSSEHGVRKLQQVSSTVAIRLNRGGHYCRLHWP
jgi:hypothetical protein